MLADPDSPEGWEDYPAKPRQASRIVPMCEHHDVPLVFLEGDWGWRCQFCFPEAFPNYRRPQVRLDAAQAVVAKWDAKLQHAMYWSQNPSYDSEVITITNVLLDLRAALAEFDPPN